MRREWFLSALIVLYAALTCVDRTLPWRTPGLIDYGSLATIVSLLIVSRGVELSGAFSRVAPRIVRASGGSEARLSILAAVAVAAASAVIMNDTAMFIFIPLLLTVSRIAGVDRVRLVVTAAIAANVGSSLTPIGNPQNIILWREYGIPFHEFVAGMLPYVLAWLGILAITVGVVSRGRRVRVPPMPAVRVRRGLLAASLTLLVADVAAAQLGHPLAALAVTVAVLAVVGREAILSLDVALVAVFTLIFVDFKEVAHLLMAAHALPPTRGAVAVAVSSALISQVVSNVPATVMLTSLTPRPPWLPLAVGVNAGGTGFVVGSLANFIAVRIAGVRLRDFHKYSLPYFAAALGVAALKLALG